MPTILVIDDNPAVATALETLFSLHDLRTHAVTSPEDGLALLQRDRSTWSCRTEFPGRHHLGRGRRGAVRRDARTPPDLPGSCYLMDAPESAVDLVKAGPADYLAKPWTTASC